MKATIEITAANDAQHLQISSMLKTILQVLDMAVEGKHPGNDMTFVLEGFHPDSTTNLPSKEAVEHAMSLGTIQPKK